MIVPAGGGIPPYAKNPFQIDGNYLKLPNGRRYKITLIFPKEEKQFLGSKDQMSKVAVKVYLMLLENNALTTFETCNRLVFNEKGLKIDGKEHKSIAKYQKLYEELLAILQQTQIALNPKNPTIQAMPLEKKQFKKKFTADVIKHLGISFLS